jgi:hypothetical protein
MPAPIAAPVAGAIIGGLSSLIGGAFGNRSRKRQSVAQRNWNVKMWNAQNAYNTPRNQMQRLRDAGLNPALMYGQGNVGNAEKVQGYQQPQIENIGAQVAQSASAGAQLSLVNTQKKLLEAQAIKTSIDGSVKAGEYDIAKQMSKYQMDKLSAETQGIRINTENSVMQLNRAKATGMLKGDTAGNIAYGLGINVNTEDGRKEFKKTLYSIIAGQAILKLAPSLINLLGSKGIFKGMPQGKFNEQADKWLNKPSKID